MCGSIVDSKHAPVMSANGLNSKPPSVRDPRRGRPQSSNRKRGRQPHERAPDAQSSAPGPSRVRVKIFEWGYCICGERNRFVSASNLSSARLSLAPTQRSPWPGTERSRSARPSPCAMPQLAACGQSSGWVAIISPSGGGKRLSGAAAGTGGIGAALKFAGRLGRLLDGPGSVIVPFQRVEEDTHRDGRRSRLREFFGPSPMSLSGARNSRVPAHCLENSIPRERPWQTSSRSAELRALR